MNNRIFHRNKVDSDCQNMQIQSYVRLARSLKGLTVRKDNLHLLLLTVNLMGLVQKEDMCYLREQEEELVHSIIKRRKLSLIS